MGKSESRRRLKYSPKIVKICVQSILPLLILTGAYYTFVIRHYGQKTAPLAVVSSPVSSAGVTTLSDIVSSTPSASATSAPTTILPSGLQAVIANFYAAYEARDTARLHAAFSPDDIGSVVAQSMLFMGNGSSGSTLFVTQSLQERVTGYTVTAASEQNANWVVSISEQRTTGAGNALPTKVTILTFIPADPTSGGWLIASYVHAGAVGKYNGFFTE